MGLGHKGFEQGEKHCNAKLTEAQAVFVMQQWKACPRELLNGFQTVLADYCGVSQMSIWRVVTSATWSHATKDIKEIEKCDQEILDLLRERREARTLARYPHILEDGPKKRRLAIVEQNAQKGSGRRQRTSKPQ